MSKILVTGGAGGVGEYVVADLAAHNIPHTVLDVREPAKLPDGVDFVRCDLMNKEETTRALRGYDTVVHLAAIPNAFVDPGEKVMAVNMVTCFNVVEAARDNGVKRIVYAGSESSTGFGIHDVVLRPEYLPIDEAHPLWPHESYSFTKRFGEEMVENFARAHKIEAISLRYCGVWMRKEAEALTAMIDPFRRGEKAEKPWFGCYVSAHDVAQAVRLATQYTFKGDEPIPFEAFYIMAETTFYGEPTLEVLKRVYDELPEVRDKSYYEANPEAPAFDIRKAKRLLGYQPTRDWRQIEKWDEQ